MTIINQLYIFIFIIFENSKNMAAVDSSFTFGLNQMSIKLFSKLSAGKNENFFISPYSISTALAMTYAGAKSDTANELKTFLGLNNFKNDKEIFEAYKATITKLNSVGQVSLNTANKIYPNNKFKLNKTFTEVVKNSFNSQVEQLDFSDNKKSAKTINDWVSNQTKNKINNLVPENALNALTQMVLVNAIYFKGNWLVQFNKDHTSKEDFHLDDGSKVKCDMMKLNAKKFKLMIEPNGLKAKICQLPYVGNSISMTIILPNRDVKLSEIESKLDAVLLKNLLEDNNHSQKVNLHLPKFKLEYKKELAEAISGLGAPTPFDENKADFSGMSEQKLKEVIYISKVIHQSFVEINEEGTEAAAATAVVMLTRMAMGTPEIIHEFYCDRPFIFLIHETSSNSILFIGKYAKP